MSTEKVLITRETWMQKLNAIKFKKEDINRLVMNFLLIEGYADAADKFRVETGIEPDIKQTPDRVAIKKAIDDGNVVDAIDRVNALNTEILESNEQLYFHLQKQRVLEMIRNGEDDEVILDFATAELAPIAEKNQILLNETEETIALLALGNAENSVFGYLLDMSQRSKIANEINVAILISQGYEKDAKLMRLLKMVLWVQYQLVASHDFPQMNVV